MKKNDLIKLLQEIDGNPIIIIQKDAEGNGHSPLSDVESELYYKAEYSWSGYIMEEDDMEEEDFEEAEKCIVLYPMD